MARALLVHAGEGGKVREEKSIGVRGFGAALRIRQWTVSLDLQAELWKVVLFQEGHEASGRQRDS